MNNRLSLGYGLLSVFTKDLTNLQKNIFLEMVMVNRFSKIFTSRITQYSCNLGHNSVGHIIQPVSEYLLLYTIDTIDNMKLQRLKLKGITMSYAIR